MRLWRSSHHPLLHTMLYKSKPRWRHDIETLSTLLALLWILLMNDLQSKALKFSLLLTWTSCWTTKWIAGDVRLHAHVCDIAHSYHNVYVYGWVQVWLLHNVHLMWDKMLFNWSPLTSFKQMKYKTFNDIWISTFLYLQCTSYFPRGV